MRSRIVMFLLFVSLAGAVSAQNRVVNGSFDSNTSSFEVDSRFAAFTTLSFVTPDGNGAAQVTNSGSGAAQTSYVYGQCIPVTPGENLVFRGRMRRPGGQPGLGNGWIFLYWYRESDCRTGSAAFGAGPEPTTDTTDVWRTYEITPLAVPADARGALVGLIVAKYTAGSTYSILFDDITVLQSAVAPAISISGLPTALQGTSVTFTASATNCSATPNGWRWIVPGGVIAGDATGSQITVSFATPGNYSVTASNTFCGSATATVPITVNPQVPDVVVSSLPLGIVQYATRTGGSTSYLLTNRGGAPSTVNLATEGPLFFDHDISSLTIPAGQSRTVFISGRAQPQGSYEGASRVSGPGVPAGLSIPIRMASTGIPIGPTRASSSLGRTEVNGPPGTNPTGSVTFRNEGTVLLEGVVSTDVPWLILSTTFVAIPVGQSVQVNFIIDLVKKAALGLLGTSTATITLRYPRSPFFLKQSVEEMVDVDPPPPSPPTSRTAATVVATTTTPVSAATIPAFDLGEFAYVVPAVGGADAKVDIAVSGTLPSVSVAGANVYLLPAGGSSASRISLPTFGANPLLYANITKTLFQQTSPSGLIQLRSKSNDSIVPVATLVSTATGRTFTVALPVFRSDRATGSEEVITLPGVRKDQNVSTDLYLQEMNGAGLTAALEFRNDAGAVLGSATRDLTSFGTATLADIVPAGATQVVVRVTGSGRVTTYAVARHSAGERAIIADWRRVYGVSAGEQIVIPIVSAQGKGPVGRRYELHVSNTPGSSPATVTADLYARQSRTRGALLGTRGSQTYPVISRTWTVQPGANRVVRDLAVEFGRSPLEGHIVVKSSGGSVSLMVEGIDSSSSGEFPGVVVPLMPRSIAKARGVVSPFTFDDSPVTDASTNGTFRTDLGLIETAGAEARVRVTIYYPPKTASAAVVVPTAEFVVAPNQSLTIDNIVEVLVGKERRQDLADLYGVSLKAQVISGEGRVIAFLVQRDNVTGEWLLRPPIK